VKVNGFWSFVGAIVLVALVAVVLQSANTSGDTTAFGSAFSSVLGSATAG
jgi:hypothetical protein